MARHYDDEIMVRLTAGLNERLEQYAAERRQTPADVLRWLVETSRVNYSYHEIEQWRLVMVDDPPWRLPMPDYWLTGQARTKLEELMKKLYIKADDAVSLILVDTIDDLFGSYKAKPAIGKVLPFRKPLK